MDSDLTGHRCVQLIFKNVKSYYLYIRNHNVALRVGVDLKEGEPDLPKLTNQKMSCITNIFTTFLQAVLEITKLKKLESFKFYFG